MKIQSIPQTPPVDHRWVRQVFSAANQPGKQIVLHDHTLGLDLSPNGEHSLEVAGVEFGQYVGEHQDDDLTSPVRMIAHIGGTREEVFEVLFTSQGEGEGETRPVIILEVSSQEATASVSAHSNTVVWLSMKDREAYKRVSDWLPQFLDLDFQTATQIANTPNRSDLESELQRNFSRILEVTHPGDPTAPFAFRRLCEAWSCVNVSGKEKLSGFSVTAPGSLMDWLAPFSSQSTGKAASIDSVPHMMGDAATRDKAKAILGSADSDPKAAVLDFLGETEDGKGGGQ